MKTKHIKNTIFLLIAISLLLMACNKKPFDYRNKYLGDYNFAVSSYSVWGTDSADFGSSDTTYTTNGSIDYGSDRHTIAVYFQGYKECEFTVYEDGTLQSVCGCSGKFTTKNEIKYSCHWASPAASTTEYVTGEKIK